jgi:hypothetical protein
MSLTIDLHTHSTASDGSLRPNKLAAHLASRGVTEWALTDHDTVDGLAEAHEAAQQHDIRFYTGVEISLQWQSLPVHVVGLGFDPHNSALSQGLQQQAERRWDRAERIARKLKASGLPDLLPAASEHAGHSIIGRPHFAAALVDGGHCRHQQDAFRRYLGRNKRAHVPMQWPELEAGIDWIHSAGGLAVMAHPHRYGLSAGKLRRLLNAFAAAGGDAMEVVCGALPVDRIQHLGRLATQRRLLASVGSDLHSPSQHWLTPGRLPRLPEDVQPIWPQLKAA